MSVTVSGDVITNVLMWLNTWCSECALLQTASVCKPCMLHSLWEFSENDTRRVCVWVWVFPVRSESVCKQTPMSSWAFGPSTTPSQRGNVHLHTHTDKHPDSVCIHALTSSTSPHTNIHKHTHLLNNALSHKHISLSSHRRQTLPCLLAHRKL